MTFDPNTHHVLMIPFLLINHDCIIQMRFYITFIRNFGYLIDKNAKIWRIYKNLHSVDL